MKLVKLTLRLLAEGFDREAKSAPWDFLKTPEDAHRSAFERCAKAVREVLATLESEQ